MEIGQNIKSIKCLIEAASKNKFSFYTRLHPSIYTIFDSIKFFWRNSWSLNDKEHLKKKEALEKAMTSKSGDMVSVTAPWLLDPKEQFITLKTFKPWENMQKISNSYIDYVKSITFGNTLIVQELISIVSELYDNSIYHGYAQNSDLLNIISSQYLLSDKNAYFSWQDFGYTIPKLIMNSSNYDGPKNELDAFKWAFIKGNTTKDYGGMGLSLILDSDIYDELVVISGKAALQKTKTGIRVFDTGFYSYGTTILMRFKTYGIQDSESRINDIKDKIIKQEKEHIENLSKKILKSKWKEWL